MEAQYLENKVSIMTLVFTVGATLYEQIKKSTSHMLETVQILRPRCLVTPHCLHASQDTTLRPRKEVPWMVWIMFQAPTSQPTAVFPSSQMHLSIVQVIT
jgi:hypothetical protein